jgi:hypothetical protein
MANGTMAATQSGGQVTPQQQNLMARQAVIRQAVDMVLPIFSRTYSATNNQGPGTIDNVPLRNVGLIKRLIIEISGNIAAGATDPLHLSYNGLSQFLSNVTYTDLSNQQRINTTGWHLIAVATAKRRRLFGGATAFLPAMVNGSVGTSISPTGYGANTGVFYANDPIAAGSSSYFQIFYEVPLSYTDHDLRGAVYANVTNATQNLAYTINPQMFGTIGQPTEQLGVYNSIDGSGSLTTFTITVYQNFLDQLPIAQQGGPVLPLLDLSTAYLLNNTAVSGVVSNQDNPIPFSNFRDFLSFTMIYNDSAAEKATVGLENMINYMALQSANYTNIFKMDPRTNYLMSRLIIESDFPYRMFYFDFRHKPISTIQYGNMEMIVNPSVVTNSQTAFFVGFEALALINMITQAGSLYGS